MPTIRHLLIIAGPSGAGKSTFLRQLACANLPGSVGDHLPPGVQNWMLLRNSGHEHWLRAITNGDRQREIPGIVLHYDMTSGLAKCRAFGDDPVLGLLRLAHSVTVLTLKLPSQQIAAQLLNRTLGPAPKSILALKRLALDFSRTVRLAIRIALLAIAPILPESVIRRLKQSGPALRAWRAINRKGIGKIKRYEQRGWLDAVYRNWQTHLTTLSRDGIEIKQVFLVPNPSAHGEVYSWRIELPPDYNNGITGVSGLSAGRS